MWFKRRVRRTFFSLFAIGVIYANIAAMAKLGLFGKPMGHMPLPGVIENQFRLFGVFSHFSTNNVEFSVWGLPKSAQGNTNLWRQLPTEDFFRYGRGENISRMSVNRHRHSQNDQRITEALLTLGQKIKHRHNLLHPQDPMDRIGLRRDVWPNHIDDYYRLRTHPSATNDFWIIAE